MATHNGDAAELLAAKYVRVTRRCHNGMVEFDFAIGEPELFAELVLPQSAFEEFCRSNAVIDMADHPSMNDGHTMRLSRVLSGQGE